MATCLAACPVAAGQAGSICCNPLSPACCLNAVAGTGDSLPRQVTRKQTSAGPASGLGGGWPTEASGSARRLKQVPGRKIEYGVTGQVCVSGSCSHRLPRIQYSNTRVLSHLSLNFEILGHVLTPTELVWTRDFLLLTRHLNKKFC